MQVETTSAASGGASAGGGMTRAGLEKAAKQFEAIFMRQMIGAMRSASLSDGINDSASTEQFQSMADSRTADSMAETGAMGIAQLLIRQFGSRIDAQESAAGSAAKTESKDKGA